LGFVVAEQLTRLARIDPASVWDGVVEQVEPTTRWRTRMQWSITADGEPGLKRHRSHEVVPIVDCVIADPGQPAPPTASSPESRVFTRVTSTGERVLMVDGARLEGPGVVHEQVKDEVFAVAADGF